MKRTLIISAVVVALLAIALASGWWWLTRTTAGANWVMARAAAATDELEWDTLDGALTPGLEITGLRLARDGTRVEIDELALAVRMRLLPTPRITVHRLHASEVTVHPGPGEPESEPAPFDPAALASPLPVAIESLQIDTLRVHRPEGEPLTIDRITLAGRYHDEIELARFEIHAPRGSVSGDGRWSLDEDFSGRMNLAVRLRLDGDRAQQFDLGLSGDLDSLDLDLRAEGPLNATGSGRLEHLLDGPGGHIELDGSLADPDAADLALSQLTARLSGRPDDWSLTASARVTGAGLPPGHWSLRASGDTARIGIESLAIETLDGAINADGQVDFGDESPAVRAQVDLAGLDLTALYPDWPEQARLDGRISGRWHGREVILDAFELSAPPTDLNVTGAGRLDPAADELALEASWQAFAWPPVSGDTPPLIASESGHLRLSGRLSDWRLELHALLEAADLPSAELDLSARGDREQARIERLRVDSDNAGRLTATGSAGWQPAPRTALSVALEQVDPSFFVPELPGRIDAELDLEAQQADDWQAGLTLHRLAGELRGRPLSGDGRLQWSPQGAGPAQLTLALGDNRIQIDSEAGEEWTWRLAAERLDQLWPRLAGSADLSGRLHPGEATLAAEGRIDDAALGDYSLDQATLEAELGWGETPRADVRLGLDNLDLNPWERIERLELTLAGDCDRHQLALALSGTRGDFSLSGHGTLNNCRQPQRTWDGQLASLALERTPAGDWRLQQPLPIRFSPESIRAGAACLESTGSGGGQLCLDGLETGATSRSSLRIERVPMDLLLLPLDPVVSLTTPLSGRVDVAWSAAGLTGLDGELRLDAGVLRPLGEERELLAINEVRLGFSRRGEHGADIDLLARLAGESRIQGQVQIGDLRDPAASRIDAQARLDLPDIGAFGHLASEFDRIGGRLGGELSVRGPLRAPELDGRIALSDGSLVHAPLGLNVEAIELALEGSPRQATLSGRARSGQGPMTLDGTLRRADDGFELAIDIAGENFTLADAEWLQLTASPDISLTADHDALAIDGDIAIDRLRAGLPPGTGERIEPSPDVEVRGERDESAPDAPPARRLNGRLGIDLGDDARLAAVGLDTGLAGQVDLLWDSDPVPRGRGVIRLPRGLYQAYGQNLEINDGEIIFTGHPVDSPRLDIRAVREIFGDTRVDAAGVHIRGNAREPEIELYTDPPTSEEKALAYVLTGADFDHAGGQGAVNVGFYLMPKLFVSYGVGLFETGNVLSGRYELSDRWGVRVVSGERDTGVDLSFSVDR